MEWWLRFAGLLQVGVASANFFAIRLFRYREEMAPVSEEVRQVFWVQNIFIVLTVVGMALGCFMYPGWLSGGSAPARALSVYLACFWAIRLAVQVFFYSPAKRRQYPLANILFLGTFVYLVVVFSLSAIR